MVFYIIMEIVHKNNLPLKEIIKMWNVSKYVRTGNYHQEKRMNCQDQIYYQEKNSVQAIALADGAGENSFASKGAKETVEFLTNLFVEHFETLYYMKETDLKKVILLEVQHHLYSKSRQWRTNPLNLNSTFIVIAIDHRSERYISAHLGDGVIAMNDGKNRTIFSYPQNGYTRDRTFLTISTKSEKPVRIQRGNINSIQEFTLLSDGWRELDHMTEGVDVAIKYLHNDLDFGGTRDDVSAICLRKAGNTN